MLRPMILFLLVVIVGAGTGGELCVSRAMKKAGEVKDFRPSALLSFVLRSIRIPWMWLAIGLMATAFFALLWALSIANVSLVVPVTALSYVVGTLGGKILLREQVTKQRWSGILLVSFGVLLVLMGRG
jgi:drug/metabolite transporter (DMT)-like permease